MRIRAAFLLSTLVFFSLATMVATLNSCTSRHTQIEDVSLRLQWVHQAQFAGFYVAKEKGFYQENGINLTIRAGGIGFNAPILVSQEKEDFGIWVGDQVLSAFDKQGMPIRAIGTVFNRSLACFMVREDSNILTPKDFQGKTVGLYPGFDTESIYIELINRFQLDRSTIKEYPAAYTIVPFLQKQVDVWPSYVINEPLAAEENGVKVRLLTPDMFGIKYYSDTLIVNEITLRERRPLVMRFLEASERGWRYALSHPDEAIDCVLKYDPSLNKEHESRMLKAMAPYINSTDPLFNMDREVWRSMAEILNRQGAVTQIESYNRLCDFGLAQEAHQSHEK